MKQKQAYFFGILVVMILNLISKSTEALIFSNVTDGRRMQSSLEDNFDYGLVAIVLSIGRSGSSNLCSLVGHLGSRHGVNTELFSGTPTSQSMIEDPLLLAQEYLRTLRLKTEHRDDVIGFKWRPETTFEEWPQQVEAWKWVSANQFKVVYNTRNLLDVVISIFVHYGVGGDWVCLKSDESCIEAQKNAKVKVEVNGVIEKLRTLMAVRNGFERNIKELGVKYIAVTYEAISSEESRIAELQRIADYVLGVGKYTASEADFASSEFALTHSTKQGDRVSNFDELVAALKGTEFAHLLRY